MKELDSHMTNLCIKNLQQSDSVLCVLSDVVLIKNIPSVIVASGVQGILVPNMGGLAA